MTDGVPKTEDFPCILEIKTLQALTRPFYWGTLPFLFLFCSDHHTFALQLNPQKVFALSAAFWTSSGHRCHPVSPPRPVRDLTVVAHRVPSASLLFDFLWSSIFYRTEELSSVFGNPLMLVFHTSDRSQIPA